MTKNPQINNDVINLGELIKIIWKGKWKIVATIAISYMAASGYHATQKNNFTATTEINPISFLEKDKYNIFNNFIKLTNVNDLLEIDTDNLVVNDTRNQAILNDSTKTENTKDTVNIKNINVDEIFPEITDTKLLDHYIELLNEKIIFQEAIRKFNLLDASQYSNEKKYNEEVSKLASSIKILSPNIDIDNRKKNLEVSYHTIEFSYHDAEKWKNVLMYVNESINKSLRETLQDNYNSTLLSLKQNVEYKFTDLKNKKKYMLEYFEVQINNLKIDYERISYNRIEYLKEQSQIAKVLGISKNSVQIQNFESQKTIILEGASTQYEAIENDYLRGYEAIDKEIELIRARMDKKAFIKGLFELEKEKRSIEQDKSLERYKETTIKKVERIESILQSTPLGPNKDFYAASANVYATKFEYKSFNKIIPIIFGLIVGLIYIMISNVISSQKVSRKRN